MIIKSKMALFLTFWAQHRVRVLTAIGETIFDSEFYFLLLFPRTEEKVSLHVTQTVQMVGKVQGLTREQWAMRNHLETLEGTQWCKRSELAISVPDVKNHAPPNIQHNSRPTCQLKGKLFLSF